MIAAFICRPRTTLARLRSAQQQLDHSPILNGGGAYLGKVPEKQIEILLYVKCESLLCYKTAPKNVAFTRLLMLDLMFTLISNFCLRKYAHLYHGGG